MVRRKQAGFTLVEIVLVLAISSSLAIIALMGFSATRQSAQFSDAVEQAKEQVLVQRTAADASLDTNGAGDNLTSVTLGKLLTFSPGSSTVNVNTLTTANVSDATTNPVVNIVDPTSFSIKWAATYIGYSTNKCVNVTAHSYQVAFTRGLANGGPQAAGNAAWTASLRYAQVEPGTGSVALCMQDAGGTRKAYLNIDLANGGVTRFFQ